MKFKSQNIEPSNNGAKYFSPSKWVMKKLSHLTDEEIDQLLLLLFNGINLHTNNTTENNLPKNISEFSDDELLRIRSRNHPDKWPNVNQEAYQAAVEEIDRRRLKRKRMP